MLTGVETRSSSPVRLPRDDTRQAAEIGGLFPVGEGAGLRGRHRQRRGGRHRGSHRRHGKELAMTFCPPQAVCFDMDGVLLDTELLGGAILAKAAQLQGCTLLQAQQDALIGANMQSTKDAFERWFPGRIDGDRFILDWCRLMLSHIRRDGLPYKPGARETLVSLRKHGLRLALCTSNAADVVAEYLHIAGWENAFDAVVTGDMVPHGKPAPDVYLPGRGDAARAAGCLCRRGGFRQRREGGARRRDALRDDSRPAALYRRFGTLC